MAKNLLSDLYTSILFGITFLFNKDLGAFSGKKKKPQKIVKWARFWEECSVVFTVLWNNNCLQ